MSILSRFPHRVRFALLGGAIMIFVLGLWFGSRGLGELAAAV